MNKNMVVSVNPHIYAGQTTQTIMRDVLIALFPAVIASIVFFGIQALLVEVVCVAVAVLCEWAFEKICRKPITVMDLSAAVTTARDAAQELYNRVQANLNRHYQ